MVAVSAIVIIATFGIAQGAGTQAAWASVTVSDPETDTWYCTYLTNGNLCIRYANDTAAYFTGLSNDGPATAFASYTGVEVHYDKLQGGTISASFTYTDQSTGVTHYDNGPVSITPPQTKGYLWKGTNPHSVTGHMTVAGQGTFDTPTLALDRNATYYSGEGTAGAPTAHAFELGNVFTVNGDPIQGPRWSGAVSCFPDSNAMNYSSNTDRLMGWSLGRLGPVYALKHMKNNGLTIRAQQINFIILFDPGDQSDFNSSCDVATTVDVSNTLKWWLDTNANARLVILAGKRTYQGDANGHLLACTAPFQTCDYGIKQTYLQHLGGYSRVLVCDYTDLGHEQTYFAFADRMIRAQLSTVASTASCPSDSTAYATPAYAYNP